MIYTLNRLGESEEGTFGLLKDSTGIQICVTCEPSPDAEHPCIPAGTYHVIPHNSSDHPNTWEITNVPNRSEILIHNGNFCTDTLGCILVGDTIGWIETRQAVLHSDTTLTKLRTILPQEFDITITEPDDATMT